ncbi:MAG TPA: DUF4493 domain-containing protein [Bacteroidales bacterium]|nr:DUF4493 domain-containing protein [Bacteroidales bacterium]
MKKHLACLVILSVIFLISCQKEKTPPVNNIGFVSIDIGLSIDINEVNNTLKSTGQTEEFKVAIFHSNGTQATSFESFASMPDTIELEPGEYYVEAYSDNDLPAAFDNPYYYGLSEVFTITSNTSQSVTVTCALANTIVSVVYSDSLKSSFTGYTTTVSSEAGSLVYIEEETRRGYFHPSPLDIDVKLTWTEPDGTESTKTLLGSIPEPLANRHYEIHVNASVDNGEAMFSVFIDESEVPVEVVEIGEDSVPAPSPGAIAYGELLITEVMANPSAMSDTYGEWFEIYNNSDHVINLQDVVIDRDGTNQHTITGQMALSPGQYLVLSKTDTAIDVSNMYVFGSSILLPNSGAVLGLYNEDTGTGPGSLIFELDYGGTNFPEGTGASISLNPALMNAVDAVQGTSWCVSTTLYSTGDAGTPGYPNDICP